MMINRMWGTTLSRVRSFKGVVQDGWDEFLPLETPPTGRSKMHDATTYFLLPRLNSRSGMQQTHHTFAGIIRHVPVVHPLQQKSFTPLAPVQNDFSGFVENLVRIFAVNTTLEQNGKWR